MGRVAVLFGGRSAEREVSMMSGAGVLEALRRRGVDAHPFDPAERALDDLRRDGFERAFIALHGRYGEDGTVQGALELLGIPYTGSGVMASAIAMDKVFTKRIWLTHGLSTPGFAVARCAADVVQAAARFGLPMAVKPSREGSTIGFTKLTSADQAAVAWEIARRHDDEVLCEEFVAGRELTVAILGSGESARALPVIEIVAPAGNYDYQNKYFRDDTRYVCPAELPAPLAARIASLALDAYRALNCEGWGRVDVMLRDADQEPFLLEVNTSPGMTGHSLVPMAARAVGMSYEDLCLAILAGASLKIGGGR
ncbi:D-alanine--D-alanine ligase [Burkholderiaceae bacterium FT117]|uniref:D-alanine--D-alanine ligase n=1 Tax=Zeimonas sediminis TaxID=2944268 RepID=UPI0023430811|nr:D-alanine--D-alanine ligase [Zeimonas sediminis]MCM5570781.1 D-alanine--D-alanine ligase [Zeimonas sediminis]